MRQVRLEMDYFIIIFHPSLHHNIHIYTYHHNHHYHHTVLAFANLGCFSKQTPMNWTMFGCWNLLMIRASIKKSISAEIQLWTFPLWQMTTTLVCWQLWQCFNGYGCFSKLKRTVVRFAKCLINSTVLFQKKGIFYLSILGLFEKALINLTKGSLSKRPEKILNQWNMGSNAKHRNEARRNDHWTI